MARKSEPGIEYFPMNTDIVLNPKIRLVVAEFGSAKTWAVLLPLYCRIYRDKGYWIDWFDEDAKLLFAQDECKLTISLVNEIVAVCIKRSLFDKGVFDMFGVLTSDRIQDNYLTAKSRQKQVPFIKEFAVKNEKNEYVYKFFHNVNIIGLNVNIISKNVYAGTQSKNEKENERVNVDILQQNNSPPDLSNSNLYRKPVIPKMEEVCMYFLQNGGTADMAEKFFQTNQSTGWFYKSSPITNFRHMVPGYIRAWQENASRKAPPPEKKQKTVTQDEFLKNFSSE